MLVLPDLPLLPSGLRRDAQSLPHGGTFAGRLLNVTQFPFLLAHRRIDNNLLRLQAAKPRQDRLPPKPQVIVPVSNPVSRLVTEYVDFTGRANAVGSVNIIPRVTGYLDKMPFKEGSEVKKGDLLFEIDPSPYKAQFDAAKAKVALSEASLKLAQVTNSALRSWPKRKKLPVSKQDLDKYKALEEEADANLDLSKANLEAAKLNLDWTKVTSPIDGQISRFYLTLGNLVNQDQTLLTTVVSLDTMYAFFDMDEPTYLRIKRAINEGKIKLAGGADKIPVLMGLQGEEGYPHKGEINFIDNQVFPTTGSISWRGVFANPKGLGGQRVLSPGMFVRIRLPIGQPHEALLVIDRAVWSDQGLKNVYVVDADNKVQAKRISTGALQEDGLRVVEGLQADDWVVVGAIQQVRPRMLVRPDKIAPCPPSDRASLTLRPDRKKGKGKDEMISRFFIDRPIFATVLSVVITLIGGIALFTLPIAQYPRITPPGVSVSIQYPGASAQVVADTVAAPIEQQVTGIPGMLYMSSQSGNDGSYTLGVTFDVSVNLNTALVMVQNRVALAMPLLPSSVQNQGIAIRKKTPDILMIVSFYSPDRRYDDIYLSNFALINIYDELLRVDGVSDIRILGERDYSIRAWLDPQKLAARNMTAIDVADAIRKQNLAAAVGQIGQPPMPAGQAFQMPVDTLGRLSDPEQFGDIIIKAAPATATMAGRLTRRREPPTAQRWRAARRRRPPPPPASFASRMWPKSKWAP